MGVIWNILGSFYSMSIFTMGYLILNMIYLNDLGEKE